VVLRWADAPVPDVADAAVVAATNATPASRPAAVALRAILFI
jgi:hypothetical protein